MTNVFVQFDPAGAGEFHQVDRYLSALDWLAQHRVDVDWVVNLTSSDYPLLPLNRARDELVAAGADGFADLWPAVGRDSPWSARYAQTSYDFHHRHLGALSPLARAALTPLHVVNYVQPWARVRAGAQLSVGRRAKTPFGPDLVLYGGSPAAALSWPVVAYVREFIARRPELLAHFRHSLAPADALLPTILGNSSDFTLIRDNKRFTLPPARHSTPAAVSESDLPEAYERGAHFVTNVDPAARDAIDARIGRLADSGVARL